MMLISYWVMGLNAPFMELVLIVWMLSLTTSSLAILVSCVSETAQKAMEIMPALITPQIMFAGIFVATSLMPYLCALKYAVNLACIVEFGNLTEGPYIFETIEIDADQKWFYLLMLVANFVGFRCLAMMMLRRS